VVVVIELAITGSAVTLNTTPARRKPREPTTTNRRGVRREALEASPELFCPCVKFNMKQLWETHSKLLPTAPQHFLNSAWIPTLDRLLDVSQRDWEPIRRAEPSRDPKVQTQLLVKRMHTSSVA
jgi:nicotinamide mononucleotide adenylyltransferase